jgi:hypothetical protein
MFVTFFTVIFPIVTNWTLYYCKLLNSLQTFLRYLMPRYDAPASRWGVTTESGATTGWGVTTGWGTTT